MQCAQDLQRCTAPQHGEIHGGEWQVARADQCYPVALSSDMGETKPNVLESCWFRDHIRFSIEGLCLYEMRHSYLSTRSEASIPRTCMSACPHFELDYDGDLHAREHGCQALGGECCRRPLPAAERIGTQGIERRRHNAPHHTRRQAVRHRRLTK